MINHQEPFLEPFSALLARTMMLDIMFFFQKSWRSNSSHMFLSNWGWSISYKASRVKIGRNVQFPKRLDLYEFVTPELKEELQVRRYFAVWVNGMMIQQGCLILSPHTGIIGGVSVLSRSCENWYVWLCVLQSFVFHIFDHFPKRRLSETSFCVSRQ